MGACTFTNTIGGKGMDPNTAYKELCRQAQYDHGHDPYNGTISTTSGYVIVTVAKGRSIDKVIDEELMGGDSPVQKWGPAGCIEMRGKALTEWKRDHGLAGTRARAFVFFGWAAE